MNEFMKVADELAKENLKTGNGGPFGAVIVKNGKIVGKGNNHVLKNNDPTAHAEVMAIRDACENLGTYDLSDCILYTSCFPCPMCISATIWSNISEIYYGNTQHDADDIGFRDNKIYEFIKNMENKNNTEILKINQMDRNETIKTFNSFKNLNGKTIY